GLWRTYDRLRMLEDELFGRFDLTSQQYNVLRLLQAHDPGTLRTLDLAARLVSRAPDITRMLDRLEERGWIERHRPSDNRRVVVVRISAAGRRLLDAIHGSLRECHARQLGHLSRGELKQLSHLLQAARKPHEVDGSHWR
ncbi:MAG TPA: MarR family winged helix-turn-helix transcriptional regulator, partial [Pirellulaceae bacterium]